jgi:hypothetical protein
VGEALRFGGIVAPASARVLGVQYESGIDQLYRIAIDPDSIPSLLSASRFTPPLETGSRPSMRPVDGFGLGPATAVSSASDTLAPEGDRKNTIERQVAVDRSDPAKPLVHLWLFTT